jgi:hypothetical protein
MVSARRVIPRTRKSDLTAPTHRGRSRIPITNFAHFGIALL